ncbi:MAG: ABC transporter ATP-binding protein [Patescibacteria group bacterium]|nr:ABC transporter ATP-binding protein [Patescibacteria group bacterium]
MIFLNSVSKFFGQKKAVDNISFKAKEGEIIGFVGPNGVGKTTTMRLILGYLKPTKGEIKVDNLNPIEERIEVLKKIGYLPENNPLYNEMKVKEYLEFVAEAKNEKNKEVIIKKVGLEEVLSQKIEELSRGFKQRVGLTAALFGNPKILILDEPTSGLDPIEQEKIRELIKKLAKEKTIIFSTHILSEVEDVANRLIIINQGKIVYDGTKPKGKGAVERLFKLKVKS